MEMVAVILIFLTTTPILLHLSTGRTRLAGLAVPSLRHSRLPRGTRHSWQTNDDATFPRSARYGREEEKIEAEKKIERGKISSDKGLAEEYESGGKSGRKLWVGWGKETVAQKAYARVASSTSFLLPPPASADPRRATTEQRTLPIIPRRCCFALVIMAT
ncbi:hypothetical protein O3P69_016976 [Scylla paramamosain]|uniref:Uncharacterized protein n=1 Tax=Scylla paramamosain TaxID=85552 RepID=A0AAW0TWM5_SCYPA